MKSKSSSRLNAARPTTNRLNAIPIGLAEKINGTPTPKNAKHDRDQVKQAQSPGRHHDAHLELLGHLDETRGVGEEHDEEHAARQRDGLNRDPLPESSLEDLRDGPEQDPLARRINRRSPGRELGLRRS